MSYTVIVRKNHEAPKPASLSATEQRLFAESATEKQFGESVHALSGAGLMDCTGPHTSPPSEIIYQQRVEELDLNRVFAAVNHRPRKPRTPRAKVTA